MKLGLLRRNSKKILYLMFSLLGMVISLQGESIRGPLKEVVTLKPLADYAREVSFTAGELVAIKLEQDSPLLTGLSLEIKLDDRIKQYADSFTLELYDTVSPEPEVNQFNFSGGKIFSHILPRMNTVELIIPYGDMSQRQSSPGSYIINKAMGQQRFPLLFTVQIILKGLPDSVLLSEFKLRVKPQLQKKGYLALNLETTTSSLPDNLEIYIDDTLQAPFDSPLLLDSGIHALLVTAENYQPESSSFLIETGKTTPLDISLKSTGAVIRLTVLPGTIIYLNGEKLNAVPSEGLVLQEGDYTFLFKTGDHSVSKSLYIEEGKEYNISLFLSVEVKES